MLVLAISVASYAIHNFVSKFRTTPENLDFRISDEGVEVEIKKFKVVHETLGRKEWELKADTAEINKQKETTKMSNVEYIYINENNRTFKVFADSGILMNKTNDLDLVGHVKMVIEPTIVRERFKKKPAPRTQPQPWIVHDIYS